MKQKDAIPADSAWKDITPFEFSGNPFTRVGKEWMLITPGDASVDKGNWNTMTASWGGFGVLWSKNVAFMFIRTTRHSFGLANAAPVFTLSFFDESRRGALNICGKASGRDTDKALAAGLTPVFFDKGPAPGAVGFGEATEIIFCRKLYTHDFNPALFLDPGIEKNYPQKDYHRMFIGEILGIKARIGG